MTRLLVAARATTAARVARSARRHGLSPVGVFTQTERDARWLSLLDDAAEVPSYDDVPALLAAARQTGASVLHPGVGFAAESAALARACLEAGLTWVGPSPQALELVTDKLALSRRAAELSVPVPLTLGPVTNLEELAQAATQVAGPAMLKTVHGGGGRGVLPLPGSSAGQLRRAWQSLAGLGPLLLQADVPNARHIEVQALADGAGGVMTLGTRECSLQRRAQKIMEEAPAPFLAEDLVQELEDWTCLVLGSAGLRGVATCEFLLPHAGTPVLLEVNARLQVEHAVSEEVSGMDLVRAQLILAQGGDLDEVLATCGGSPLPSSRGAGTRRCCPPRWRYAPSRSLCQRPMSAPRWPRTAHRACHACGWSEAPTQATRPNPPFPSRLPWYPPPPLAARRRWPHWTPRWSRLRSRDRPRWFLCCARHSPIRRCVSPWTIASPRAGSRSTCAPPPRAPACRRRLLNQPRRPPPLPYP